MGAYTLALTEVSHRDPALAGGKGANLGELAGAGLPVPAGFVVTTVAYTDFIGATGLSGSDPEELPARIRKAPVPEDIGASVVSAYRELGSPAVAVRSSGTAEDLTDVSFAGQHDTYLNVRGEKALLTAMRDCWASLWTPRAVAYRQRYGWDKGALSLAVVVQTMVDAEWAGVMFTADPVTGRRDRIVVESVRGLGESLVSGQETGHRHVLDKGSGRVLSTDPSVPGGALDELGRLGAAVEQVFGSPQDVEWTYAEGQCSLVQARPLTALPEEPVSEDKRGKSRKSHPGLQMAIDHLPYPPFPMDVSLSIRPAVRSILGGLRSAGFDTPDLDGVLVEIDEGVIQIVPRKVRPTPRALVRVPAVLPKLASVLRTRPADWLARYHANVTPLIERIDGEQLAELSDQDLIDRIETLRRAQGELVLTRFGCAVPGLLADRALEALLRLAMGPERGLRLHTELMSAIPTVTRDANDELDRLAGSIHTTPELLRIYSETEPEDIPDRLRDSETGRALLADMHSYVRRYGYRQSVTPLPSFTPLRDAPETLHRLLKGLSRVNQDDSDPQAEQSRAAHAREELAAGHGMRTRIAVPLALALLDPARSGVAIREDSHFHLFMVPAAVLHRVLLELGHRLVERGHLTEAGDIFYVELDEVRQPSAGRLHEVAARRKAARSASLDHYTVIPADRLRRESDGPAVHGTSASRGTVVGRVCVVRDESEFAKLAGGDVLVCPYTNPTWTPLFSLAGAVVADAGGVGSHAAIVAREYGIPAVMGTGNGTRELADGQWVRVDGDSGTVEFAAEPVARGSSPDGNDRER